jgi:hypothetical protein
VTIAAPLSIAGWVLDAGFTGISDPNVATAIALSFGRDPARPGGLWNVGGPTNDGPAQAKVAYGVFKDKGWGAFNYNKAAAALYLPVAQASVIAAQGLRKSEGTPAGDVANTAVSAATGLQGTLQPFIEIGTWLTTPGGWERIVKMVVGVGLIFIGWGLLAVKYGGLPVLRAVGIADEKVAQQAALVDHNPPRAAAPSTDKDMP